MQKNKYYLTFLNKILDCKVTLKLLKHKAKPGETDLVVEGNIVFEMSNI